MCLTPVARIRLQHVTPPRGTGTAIAARLSGTCKGRSAFEHRWWGVTSRLGHISTRLDEPTAPAFVLAGEAGVGKTRLASEAASVAAGRGFVTAEVVASRSAGSIPSARSRRSCRWGITPAAPLPSSLGSRDTAAGTSPAEPPRRGWRPPSRRPLSDDPPSSRRRGGMRPPRVLAARARGRRAAARRRTARRSRPRG